MVWTKRGAMLCGAAIALAGCGLFADDAPKPRLGLAGSAGATQTVDLGDGYGLYLPTTLAGFTRGGVEDRAKNTEAVADYVLAGPPGPITATIRVSARGGSGGTLIPFIGEPSNDATAAESGAALAASLAALRRQDPTATFGAPEDVFLVRFGTIQHGRAVSGTGTDGGTPVRLRIETFCCVGGRWSYEYRFRIAQDAGPAAEERDRAFERALAWSKDPAASVEPPQ